MDDVVQELGIDEAGYAPRLGPLVITATAITRPSAATLYGALKQSVCRTGRSKRSATGIRQLRVGDSKKLYSPAQGVAELERGVLAFVTYALGERPVSDLELARSLTDGTIDIDGLPWYEGPPVPLPVSAGPADVAAAADMLSADLASAGIEGLSIRSRFITARDLNNGVSDERNKADLLCGLVAGLLAEMGAGRGNMIATVDRLGGRKDYLPLLESAWPGARIESISVSRESSSYHAHGPAAVRRTVAFACRAEDASLPVALSSMFSKYLRELFMMRLNRWFASHVEGIQPTAGYPVDAARFLAECATFREHYPLPDELLIRSR